MKTLIKDKWYDERVQIALKAFKEGYVIFSPDSQKWYTSRTYVESGEEVTYRDPYGTRDKLPTVVLHQPGAAIVAQIDRVELENAKLKLLVKSINEAFNFDPANKKH
ncbi:MAG: hypothetical protein V4687_01040 [Bacteroidota bacterium]